MCCSSYCGVCNLSFETKAVYERSSSGIVSSWSPTAGLVPAELTMGHVAAAPCLMWTNATRRRRRRRRHNTTRQNVRARGYIACTVRHWPSDQLHTCILNKTDLRDWTKVIIVGCTSVVDKIVDADWTRTAPYMWCRAESVWQWSRARAARRSTIRLTRKLLESEDNEYKYTAI